MTAPETEQELQEAAAEVAAKWAAMSHDERRYALRHSAEQHPPSHYDAVLVDAYIEYAATVSPDWMAMSYAAASFLDGLCRDHSPRLAVDFGSGFSSYVLRRYAAETGARVVSVDTDPDWLQATREYLELMGVGTDGLVTWKEWLATRDDYPPIDLAFHDLASGHLREAAMPLIADQMRIGGVLVFDDAQNGDHKKVMDEVAASHGWALTVLPETMDGHGRFDAMCVCRATATP